MRRCFICAEDNPKALESHHLIPRRLGGDDSPENIVTLCANCHKKIESMYDRQFFDRLKGALLEDQDFTDLSRQQGLKAFIGEKGYTCPICERETNRNGEPFSSVDAVMCHIHASRDSQHDVDTSNLPDKIKNFGEHMRS